MGYSTILVDRTDGVATITLNRPEARNALDLVMRRELLSVLDELDADAACRVVVLTGAGGHFSAGGDVKTMAARRHTAAEGRARVESLNRFVVRLFEFPKPTIAMVDGFAVGAGCNIALGCDILIASDRARFGEVFARIGLVPDGGGTWLLPRLVGLAKAKELVFSADIIDAAEALRIGLVNRVVPAAELETTTRAFAARSLDCYVCHGDVPAEHTKRPERAHLSKKSKEPARVVTSVCAQCHVRTGRAKSSGLPYPNTFVAGDNLFRDFRVDFSDEALKRLKKLWQSVYGQE